MSPSALPLTAKLVPAYRPFRLPASESVVNVSAAPTFWTVSPSCGAISATLASFMSPFAVRAFKSRNGRGLTGRRQIERAHVHIGQPGKQSRPPRRDQSLADKRQRDAIGDEMRVHLQRRESRNPRHVKIAQNRRFARCAEVERYALVGPNQDDAGEVGKRRNEGAGRNVGWVGKRGIGVAQNAVLE